MCELPDEARDISFAWSSFTIRMIHYISCYSEILCILRYLEQRSCLEGGQSERQANSQMRCFFHTKFFLSLTQLSTQGIYTERMQTALL